MDRWTERGRQFGSLERTERKLTSRRLNPSRECQYRRMAIRIPYGLKDGSVVHIRDVASGLACQCACINCGGELIARKGPVREDHFAHRSGADCVGLAEGVLHRVAKDILCSLNRFEVPEYVWERSRHVPFGEPVVHRKRLTRAGAIRVLHAYPEFRMPPNFVPDVVLFAASARQGPKPLFVEIVVSNRIQRLKQRRIRRYGVPTIEIRLTAEDLLLSPEDLRSKLEGLSTAKRWVFHPLQIACEKAFVADFRRRRLEAMKVVLWERPKDVNRDLRKLIRSKKRARSTGMAEVLEVERWVQGFYDKHQRYPSLEEARALRKR